MFLVKVFRSYVRLGIFLILFNKCLASSQDTNSSDQNIQTGYEGLLANSTKHSDEKPEKNSTEKNSFVYTSQNLNQSTEKIQTMDNGKVTKSTYVPIIPNELSFNYSESVKEKRSESISKNNKSISTNGTTGSSSSMNEKFVIKNGKKYKIVKVKKTVKNSPENQPKNQMQRRTFKPLPSFLSFFPLNWMTRQKKNDTETHTKVTEWSKLNHIENREENSKENPNQGIHSSDKVKKLLNLFTIVKFENGECSADGIEGICIHRLECESKGGKSAGNCAEELGVCCYFEMTCGDTSNDIDTYFVNEGYPDSSADAPKVCTLTLEKADPDVKQIRLDFQIFQLREPTNGTCLHDRLVISGQDLNNVVPEICGTNTGQHIYVDVEDSGGPFNINILTMGEYFPRNFRIKITQIKREDGLLAPKNCLQYYAEPAGYVQSFNYQRDINENLEEVENGYFNNLNYVICIKKQKGFCSISYENEEIQDPHPTFHLVNVDEEGNNLLPPRQAGAETFDCPDDYIIINGMRLCGEKLNDALYEVDYTKNYPVTDTTNGPFILSVRTDASISGRGFNLKFVQHPCLT